MRSENLEQLLVFVSGDRPADILADYCAAKWPSFAPPLTHGYPCGGHCGGARLAKRLLPARPCCRASPWRVLHPHPRPPPWRRPPSAVAVGRGRSSRYPHLTVANNLAFPLRVQGVRKVERRRKVGRVGTLLGLGSLLDRKPRQISGGQRQRAAVLRELAGPPEPDPAR